jgi:hypothetical protein
LNAYTGFYINLPVGAVALGCLILTKIPDLTTKAPFSLSLVRKVIPELDLIGFALFAPASVMLLLALQFGGNDYPWNSSVIIGLFCGSAVVAIIFGLWEYHVGDKAMIPGSIITQRLAMSSAVQVSHCFYSQTSVTTIADYSLGHVSSGHSFRGQYIFPHLLSSGERSRPNTEWSVFITEYFQSTGCGDRFGVVKYVLFSIIRSPLGGCANIFPVSKLGYFTPWAIGAGAVSAIGNGLVSTFSPTTSTARWVGYQILLGAGRGAGMQTVCPSQR